MKKKSKQQVENPKTIVMRKALHDLQVLRKKVIRESGMIEEYDWKSSKRQ